MLKRQKNRAAMVKNAVLILCLSGNFFYCRKFPDTVQYFSE